MPIQTEPGEVVVTETDQWGRILTWTCTPDGYFRASAQLAGIDLTETPRRVSREAFEAAMIRAVRADWLKEEIARATKEDRASILDRGE